MNYIGIDPSLTSTGVTINFNQFLNYTTNNKGLKNGKMSKWYELCSKYIKYHFHDFTINNTEKIKINQLNNLANKIVKDIIEICPDKDNTIITMESYSYNSSGQAFIDTIVFGSYLRIKLMAYYNIENVHLISPTQIKSKIASQTCEKTFTNKKQTTFKYVNERGITGGAFKKDDIYTAILKIDSFKDIDYVKFLRIHYLDLVNHDKRKVEKPAEDVNDSLIMCWYSKNLSLT